MRNTAPAVTDTRLSRMSDSSDRSKQNQDAVKASVTEFLNIWGRSGDASLTLKCIGGHVTMAYSCSFASSPCESAPSSLPPGHTGAKQPRSHHNLHSPLQPRHRGPGDKERSRRRAASYQEKQRLAGIQVPNPLLPSTRSNLQVTTLPPPLLASQ